MEPKRLKNTIVIADDSLAQRKLLQSMLLPEGYDVVLLTDGKEVLEYLQRFTPDLLVLDVNMPHLDGLSICDRVKRHRRTRDVPVVIVTSLGDEKTRNTSHFVKADGFLDKPIEKEALLPMIKELVALHHEHEEERQTNEMKATLAGALLL